MYQKIATNGIVLHKRVVGEANVRVAVLTDDLGLVVANARSARRQESKLRYGLEPLTLARFCFVRGLHEWRLVQVESPCNLFVVVTPTQRSAAGRISQLLLRLIHGQEPSPLLYKDVIEGFALLASAKSTDEIEVVLVLRILSRLGYLPHTEALAPFVDEQFSLKLSAQALASRALLVRAINEALQATGL
jgi:DNA repair protein RecO